MPHKSNPHEEGAIVVTLKSYLERLVEGERVKHSSQRSVPTLTDLAEVAGVNKATISRLANGGYKSLSFDIAVAILDELNRRGFPTRLDDIISYYPPYEE